MSDPARPTRHALLHGVTLEQMLIQLELEYGWAGLGQRLPIACFLENPSLSSSLKFLRKVSWARERLEGIYLEWARRQPVQAEPLPPTTEPRRHPKLRVPRKPREA